MKPLGPAGRVYALCAPVDMRRGFEGLWALATQQMGHDVLAGDLFLFLGKDCRRAKVLFFDGTGLCLLHKRLEQGRFACLWRSAHGPVLGLSTAELQLFLEGCALVGKLPLSPPALSPQQLRVGAAASR